MSLRQWVKLAIVGLCAIMAVSANAAQQDDMLALMKKITESAKAGRYDDATALARKLVKEAEKASGRESPLTGVALFTLAQTLQVQGNTVEAETLFKKVLVIREKALGPDHPDVAAPLNNLAQIALAKNELANAERYIGRAIAIEEKSAKDPAALAMSRMQLGNIRHRQAREAEALGIFSAALETFKSTRGPSDITVALALNNIAEVYKALGRFELAEKQLREALDIQEKLNGRDSLYTAAALNNLGDLYRLQGRLGDAEDLARRTLDIREKALGPDHPDVAGSLINLGIVFSREGRASEAEGLLLRGEAILAKSLGPDHPDVATALNNFADAASLSGSVKEAEALFRRSLAIREKSLGRTHVLVAVSLDNLVAILVEQSRFEEAEPLAQRSLAIRERGFDKDHPLIATSLDHLAVILDTIGKHAEAKPLLDRALEIRTRALSETHPDVALSLNNLGAHFADVQDWRSAYDTFAQATAIWIARGASNSVGDRGAAGAEIRENADPFVGAIVAAYKLAETADKNTASAFAASAFETAQWVGDVKASSAITGMSARIAAGDGELAVRVREKQDLDEQVQAMDRALIASASLPAAERNFDAEAALRRQASGLKSKLRDLDGIIASRFPDYATLIARNPIAAAAVQALLAPDEALLLFTTSRDYTFVWTITKSEVRWHAASIGTKALAETVSVLRCGLDSSNWRGDAAADCARKLGLSDLPTAGTPIPFDFNRAYELYKALFRPVRDTIEGKKLILVPSGALATLPFHVLITEKPEARFASTMADYAQALWFAKRYAATVLPSVSSLKGLRQFAKASRATRPFIGFGNPLLDGDRMNPRDVERAAQSRLRQSCESVSSPRVALLRSARRGPGLLSGGRASVLQLKMQSPLPETADELCSVAGSFKPDGGDVRLGARATETEVKTLSETGRLSDYRIVHFATHGALAGQVVGSVEPGLIMTPPDTATATDDGYLTASEISGLKLNADAVVLSACNTAGAERGGTEAFSGLGRAFFFAGARSLLVTHWAVDSNSAVKLVTGAIAVLQADPGVGLSEALRRSMVFLIEAGPEQASHPALWAPFVVVGEGFR